MSTANTQVSNDGNQDALLDIFGPEESNTNVTSNNGANTNTNTNTANNQKPAAGDTTNNGGTVPSASGASTPATGTVPANNVGQPPAAGTQPTNTTGIAPEQVAKIVQAMNQGNANAGGGNGKPPVALDPFDINVDDSQLDEAGLHKRYGVYIPGEKEINTILAGGPEGAKGLAEVIHNTVKFASQIAQVNMMRMRQEFQQALEQRMQSVQPVVERAQNDELNYHRTEFFKTYPGFTPEHEPILQAAYRELAASGYKSNNPAEVYKTIADKAASLIKAVNPNFDYTNQAGKPAPQGSGPQPTSMSTGSGSGIAVGTQPKGGASNFVEEIFGE